MLCVQVTFGSFILLQALKHLKNYISLFSAFTSSAKSEMVLCNKVQEYCYDNQNFLKCFNKIVLLFYKTEVLSEEVILKWYKDGHVPKGWTVFMEQMKKFIDWLEQAESGKSCHQYFKILAMLGFNLVGSALLCLGLKRQAGGVSLSSLTSCLSPHSTTHPWSKVSSIPNSLVKSISYSLGLLCLAALGNIVQCAVTGKHGVCR